LLLQRYPDGRILVIGAYIGQVETIAKEIGAPLVAGKTPEIERERIYERFRKGELRCIVLSKVGNFAIDLPDADLLIQVSGAFGSRQEEAQRLGRVLRPKDDGRAARFFTLVSRDTREEEFAHHRKLFSPNRDTHTKCISPKSSAKLAKLVIASGASRPTLV
jgi:DNA excision repair protein ERCC-3